jgi:hypothetical protein
MTKWQEYYTIVEIENIPKEGQSASSWMMGEYSKYHLLDPDGKIIGIYKDKKYAKKQAKYKFKKILAKLERILLA